MKNNRDFSDKRMVKGFIFCRNSWKDILKEVLDSERKRYQLEIWVYRKDFGINGKYVDTYSLLFFSSVSFSKDD